MNNLLYKSYATSQTNKNLPAISDATLPVAKIVFFVLLHIPLALAMKQFPLLATGHALFTFSAGMFFLMFSNNAVPLIYVIAYITGAEIIWRATGAAVFSEYGKISISVLLLIALLRQGRVHKIARWPVFYFALLLPGIALMPTFDRETLSFVIGGHIALVIISIYFNTVVISYKQLIMLFIALIAPALGMTTIASYTTFTAENIYFGRNSLLITAGGIGPNQVSAILGLGALACWLIILMMKGQRILKIFMLACSIWMLAQCLLTFSRGGLWAAVGGLIVAIVFIIRNRRKALSVLLFLAIFTGILFFFLLPKLNEFTGGALLVRYESIALTHRDEIAKMDIQIFTQNPIFGVGVGQSVVIRDYLSNRWDAAHIEYTRILAEHGVLGIMSILILLGVAIQRLIADIPSFGKATTMSFTIWAFLFMFSASTRLVAPSFTFGFATAHFLHEEE